MEKQRFLKLNSNNGFTMQDLIIAIAIFTLFAGIIGTAIVATFRVQSDSQVDEVGTLYAIQIAEYIDKVSFEEVDTNITSKVVTNLQIPNTFDVEINVTDYKPGVETESYVKVVKINLKYFYYNETQNFSIDKLKIKEL